MIDLTSRLKLKKPDENERVDIDIINDNMDLLDETFSTLMRMERAWQNASPTSEFAAQTISLDLSEYDFIMVLYMHRVTFQTTLSSTLKKGQLGNLISVTSDNLTGYRSVTFTDSGVTFGECIYSKTNSNNGFCVPYEIYGIKGVQ